MSKTVFSIFGVFFLATSLAMNWQAFSELKEMDTSAHLAAYSDRAHPDADRTSDADHDHGTDPQDQESVAGSHTHKHRHAPGEPEHEHSHADLALISVSLATNVSSTASKGLLIVPPVRQTEFMMHERVSSSWVLSSLLRPPIG